MARLLPKLSGEPLSALDVTDSSSATQILRYYDTFNFDSGSPAAGGLATMAADEQLMDFIRSQPATKSYHVFGWRAILSGTRAMRDGLVALAEVTLIVVTLLLATIIPQMTYGNEERDFEGDEATVLAFARAVLYAQTCTIACALSAFIIAWDLVYQAYECPSSRAFVLWVMQTQSNFVRMVLLSVCALFSTLASTFTMAAAQQSDLRVDVGIACAVAICFIGAWTVYTSRKHWHAVQYVSERQSAEDIKLRAIERLYALHRAHVSHGPEEGTTTSLAGAIDVDGQGHKSLAA